MAEITEEQIQKVMDATSIMAEATIGYFKKLTDGGLSVEIASKMTDDFHSRMIEVAFPSSRPTASYPGRK